MPHTWLTVAIVAVTYAGIAVGRYPWLKCNRATIALVGVGALLVAGQVHPQQVFAEFDWSLLVFFCGLFVLSGVLEANGVTQRLFSFLHVDGSAGVWGLTTVSTALSNLVSNVPAVLLLKPVVAAMANPTAGWLTLAASSTLAGNLTLLGSVANLIVAESAAGKGVHLGFWAYTRAGLLITALSLALGGLWLQWVVWG